MYTRKSVEDMLCNRRLQAITVLMYKVKHDDLVRPEFVSDLFVRKGHTHSLRNGDFLLSRFTTTRYDKQSIRCLGSFLFKEIRLVYVLL